MQSAASVASQDKRMCDETVPGCYSPTATRDGGEGGGSVGILTPIKWLVTRVVSKSIKECLK